MKLFTILGYSLLLLLSSQVMADTFVLKETIDFGTVNATNGICSINKNGKLSGVCKGTGTVGIIRFKNGIPNASVNVSVHSGTTGVPGAIFQPKLAKTYTELNRKGALRVKIIGDLHVTANASGAANLSYQLDVDYN